MTRQEKEGRARSGNSEPVSTEESRLAAKTSDSKDYSDFAHVYVISAARVGRGVLPKPELGKTERQVINTATRLAEKFRDCETPLPLQCVIAGDQKRLYFGKQFALEKDVTGTTFADELSGIVEEGVIGYIAVMLDDFAPSIALISYGRKDRPEFFASVFM